MDDQDNVLLFDREMDGSQVEENAAEILNWIEREKFDYLAETISNSRGNSVYVSKKAGTTSDWVILNESYDSVRDILEEIEENPSPYKYAEMVNGILSPV